MITVANTTYTSARIKYSFHTDSFLLNALGLGELANPEKTLQIDSSILNKVEKGEFGEFNGEETEQNIEEDTEVEAVETEDDALIEKKKSKREMALELRAKVDTVGRIGEPGEQIQNVISVGMLSEGWDAKTVTHIMGLRAFSSQLLCEQVVGRGLRRTEYEVNPETGLFEPEYVNIFGVPFTFLPHEDSGGGTPRPPKPTTEIKTDKEKKDHRISFPNILRIDHTYKPKLAINLAKVKPLILDPYESITEEQLGAIIAGKPSNLNISEIDLIEVGRNTRMQTIIFKVASAIYNIEKKPDWKGSKDNFLIQLISIIEKFINPDKIGFKNPLFNQDEVKKRILLMLNMNKVIQHIWNEIRAVNTAEFAPIFDKEHPIRSTSDLRTWWSSKPCHKFDKTHINFVVVDSKLEFLESKRINDSKVVKSFVKNDHLGFAITYNYQGIVNRYFPDFIIKLTTGENLILETKGKDTDKDKTKRAFLNDWCRAVNQHGGFGKWSWAVSFDANDLDLIIQNSTLSFSGHIFVDTDDYDKAERIFEATRNLFDVFGFEIAEEGKIEIGSFKKRGIVYKIKNIFRSKEAKEVFDKTKKALELAHLEKVQSEVNKNNMSAVSDFLNSVKEVPNVATIMGSLVIIKATVNGIPQLLIRNLTIEEVIVLDRMPELKNNPLELLNKLNSSTPNSGSLKTIENKDKKIKVFCYGSNMSSKRLKAKGRCPSAEFHSVAYLEKYKFAFNKKSKKEGGSGKGNIIHTGNKEDKVWGIVFELTPDEKKILGKTEMGYDEIEVDLIDRDDSPIEAITYMANKDENIDNSLAPFDWYKEHCLKGAEEFDLPEKYREFLNSFQAKTGNSKTKEEELMIYSN
jgi:hypothetical protein